MISGRGLSPISAKVWGESDGLPCSGLAAWVGCCLDQQSSFILEKKNWNWNWKERWAPVWIPIQQILHSHAEREIWSGCIHSGTNHHGRWECICMLRETGSCTDWFPPEVIPDRPHLRDVTRKKKKLQKPRCDRLLRSEEDGAKLFIRCVPCRSCTQMGFFMERSGGLIDTALSASYSLPVKPNLIHCLSRSLASKLSSAPVILPFL